MRPKAGETWFMCKLTYSSAVRTLPRKWIEDNTSQCRGDFFILNENPTQCRGLADFVNPLPGGGGRGGEVHPDPFTSHPPPPPREEDKLGSPQKTTSVENSDSLQLKLLPDYYTIIPDISLPSKIDIGNSYISPTFIGNGGVDIL